MLGAHIYIIMALQGMINITKHYQPWFIEHINIHKNRSFAKTRVFDYRTHIFSKFGKNRGLGKRPTKC
jgi:hypothetical protein